MVVAGALLLVACSAATPTRAPTTAAPTAAPPTAPPLTNSKSFWIGFTSTGLSSAPFLSAIAKLNEQGYDIKTPILAQSELVAEGVAQGQFAFGSGANNAVLLAIEKGANLKVVVDRVANEWTLYGRTETIHACADLAGKRLALHSAGAVSTAMVHNYINTECPGTLPQEVFIEGSPNRVAALLADEIDASPLELGDSITIDTQAGDTFSLLSSFSADLPNLKTTSIYVNGDWAAQNPESVKAVVKAVIEEFRLVSADTAYLKTVAEAQVPAAINEDTIDLAVAKYVELGMFPVNGGVTAENLQYTAEFFGPNGTKTVATVIPTDQWSDLSYLNAVLDELGRK
jgi:NitT/TauT family transport system substrate-binding protein